MMICVEVLRMQTKGEKEKVGDRERAEEGGVG